MNHRRARVWLVAAGLTLGGLTAAGDDGAIRTDELKQWLTYVASDELEGRQTFSAGLGLTAGYLQSQLARWNVTPKGDGGTFLQTVRVRSVKATSHSSVTVRVGKVSKVFRDGEGIRFPRNAGGKRTLTVERVEFLGYGLHAPGAGHSDYAGKDVRNAAVVYLGTDGPKAVDAARYRRLIGSRSREAIDQRGASATVGPQTSGERAGRREPRGENEPDFVTAQALDHAIAPAVTAGDEFFEFLFSASPAGYGPLKKKAAAQEPLPAFTLEGVSLTFAIDTDYEVVRTQLTHNVVAAVEGSDPALRDTYVAFGAHYDHVGYAERDLAVSAGAAPGRITPGTSDDRIWNGADDDGSGTVALLALAKAFATSGARPRRSALFVWHTGEEHGLWGSRAFVDAPTVPLDRVVAQLNLDMIGRNRDNDPAQANTVYLVGSDRISTELHALSQASNAALAAPLTLDFEMNDPGDPEQLYFRSDHYSYAARGVPIIFFTTGLHPDYHANTDEVSRIEFGKMTRITELVWELGRRLANLDHAPVRDNLGPRAGKGTHE